MESPMTMQRPAFNHRRSEAAWTDAEIATWIGRAEAYPDETPWRLQWIEDAKAVLDARAKAGASV
jgi:hypothetical protein